MLVIIQAKKIWSYLFNHKRNKDPSRHGNLNIEEPSDNRDTNNADANNAAEMDAADAACDSVWSHFGLVTNIILVTH